MLNFKLYADGWTFEYEERLDAAIRKAERYARISGKEITIYDQTTRQQFIVKKK